MANYTNGREAAGMKNIFKRGIWSKKRNGRRMRNTELRDM
jgi:hypothetical protein